MSGRKASKSPPPSMRRAIAASEELAASLAREKVLAKHLRDMIDWLDDDNRVLSDCCRADVAAARLALEPRP